GEQSRLGPRITQDLSHAEVPMGMLEQEFEQLELACGHRRRERFVGKGSGFAIQPQAVQIPHAPIPEIQPLLIAVHLGRDYLDVSFGYFASGRRKFRNVATNPVEETSFEFDQVGINTHPVARVFPMSSSDILALHRVRKRVHIEEMWHPDWGPVCKK